MLEKGKEMNQIMKVSYNKLFFYTGGALKGELREKVLHEEFISSNTLENYKEDKNIEVLNFEAVYIYDSRFMSGVEVDTLYSYCLDLGVEPSNSIAA